MAILTLCCSLAGCAQSVDDTRQTWYQLRTRGLAALSDSQYRRAAEQFESARKVAHQINGTDVRIAISLADLASVYERDGTYKQAQPIIEDALKQSKSAQETSSENEYIRQLALVRGLINLASICARENQFEIARTLYEKAILICQQLDAHSLIGSPNKIVGYYWSKAVCGLVDLHVGQGQYAEASRLITAALASGLRQAVPDVMLDRFVRACRQVQKVVQPTATLQLDAIESEWSRLSRTGSNLLETGKIKEAVETYQKALNVVQKLGPTDAHYLRAVYELGRAYNRAGDFSNAERMLTEAQRGLQTSSNQELESKVLSNLLSLYRIKKKYALAESVARRQVSIAKDAFGPQDMRTINALSMLAQICLLERKFEEAQTLLESCAASLRTSNGAELELGTVLSYLGATYLERGMKQEAIRVLQSSQSYLEEGSAGARLDWVKEMLSRVSAEPRP